MSGVRQVWLVARRELLERSRSKGLWAGTAFLLLAVVASIVLPAVTEGDGVTRDVAFAGTVPADLPAAVTDQGRAVDVTVRTRRFEDAAAGERALRDDDVDVLVVDARRLLWRGDADERLRALVTGAIQLVAVQERAAAAGISTTELARLAAPVPVANVEIGIAAGRSPADETAAYVMSVVLLIAMATYGQLVLTGVVQEKSSRVVEVLLARMPARTLLAGKVTGIGLLGFAQLAVTGVAALVATAAVDDVELTAVSGDVVAWVVVWFLLGYAIFAMAYGAFGSLASRTEDASGIAAPVNALLLVGYWASLVAVGGDPDGGWATLASFVPATAPFAMPGRVALGVTAWWEPIAAAGLTLVALVGLVRFAGRVYAGAILRTGATVKLRDAWRRTTGRSHVPRSAPPRNGGRTVVVLAVLAVSIGVGVAVAVDDVVAGVAAGAGAYAVVSRVLGSRTDR